MDANKREVLIDIGYVIRPCCGRCRFADIAPLSDWGTCKVIGYDHEKHTDSRRKLSINRHGVCESFMVRPSEDLLGFNEFKKDFSDD